MTISRQDVDHIADLARLALTEDEKGRLAQDLSAILAYFERLDELDTSAISPTASVRDLASVLREDAVRPSLDRDLLLQTAPQADVGCFEVPPVIEDEAAG